LGSVCAIDSSWIALALLTHTSMPPKRSTVCSTTAATEFSSRTSPTIGSARTPAASISAAAVWIVPGSFGLGSAVLASRATLAPSRAARSAIARPDGGLPAHAAIVKPDLVERALECCAGHRGAVLDHEP